MLARLQQLVVAVVFGLAALLSAWGWRAGHPLAGFGAGLALVLGYVPFLALEYLILAAVRRGDPTPPASAWQMLRAWAGEVRNAARVFYWRQPFRSHAVPDHLPAAARGLRGVVLVHGFVCNRGLWNPVMLRLRAAGVPFVAVNLEPVFGDIDRYPPIVEAAVRQLEAATGLAPVIVAHSMGGLATRAWLRAFGADARVHRVITVGTPHRGTWLGRFGHAPNTRQMRHRSDWVNALAAAEPPSRAARFTCFYSNCDNIVMPPSTATLPGADNRHLPGWSHVHLAFHPAVFDEVLRSVKV
jgi:triacylglycerol esterase/lipase EstA (alpha/beta hydrolase family)